MRTCTDILNVIEKLDYEVSSTYVLRVDYEIGRCWISYNWKASRRAHVLFHPKQKLEKPVLFSAIILIFGCSFTSVS